MTSADVAAAFDIAIAGREKSFTREGLYAAGITEQFVIDSFDVTRSVQGWACECDEKIVGVAMGNQITGEFWAMAVLPEYEGRGIGSELYRFVVEWLFSQGWKELWLGVQPELQANAYSFFRKRGWEGNEMRGPFRILKISLAS